MEKAALYRKCKAVSLAILILLAAFAVWPSPDLGQERSDRVIYSDCNHGLASAVTRLGTLRFRQIGDIQSIAISPNGRMLASGGEEEVKSWNVAAGSEFASLAWSHKGKVTCTAISPDNAILAIASTYLELRDLSTGVLLRKLVCPRTTLAATAIAFSPDGRMLVSGGPQQPMRLWDVGSGKLVRELEEHTDWVCCVAFSRDGTMVASGGDDCTVRLWEMATGKVLRVLPAGNRVHCLVFLGDKTLLSGGRDDSVCLWNVDGKLLQKLNLQDSWTQSMAAAPDGKTVAIAGWNRGVCLFDVTSGTTTRWRDCSGPVAFAPDGRKLACVRSHTVRLLDLASTGIAPPSKGHEGKVTALRQLPMGKDAVVGVPFRARGLSEVLLTVGSDANVILWDLKTRKEVSRFRVPTSKYFDDFCAADVSSDGRHLALAEKVARFVWLCELPSGKVVGKLEHAECISSLRFSPDGTELAFGSDDKSVGIWSVVGVVGGNMPRILRGHESRVTCVTFSPDGTKVATGSDDMTVRIWDKRSGKPLGVMSNGSPNGSEGAFRSIAFSPDGRALAAVGEYGTVQRWSVGSGRLVFTNRPPDFQWSSIYDLAFSPDGVCLAVARGDNMPRLYDAHTGQVIRQLPGHEGPVNCVSFVGNGRYLASGSADTTVLLWDLSHSPHCLGAASSEQLAASWAELGSRDAPKAYAAIWNLVAAGHRTVLFLESRLRPSIQPPAEQVARMMQDLDSPLWKVRERATTELEESAVLGAAIVGQGLPVSVSMEARRRIEQIESRLDGPILSLSLLRSLRAVAVLERIASPEAQHFLSALAKGAPGARLTMAAESALVRLKAR